MMTVNKDGEAVETPEPIESPIVGETVPYGEVTMEYRSEEVPQGEPLTLVFKGDETPEVHILDSFPVGTNTRYTYVLIWGAGRRHHG